MSIRVRGRYFYLNGRRLRLAGDHTWNTVQRIAGEKVSIDRITGNFTRLWTIETRGANFGDSSWGSNTKGVARVSDVPWKKDGSLNWDYYKSLRNVVRRADKRDIVTGVVLFEGSMPEHFPGAWENHAFNGLGPKSADKVHTKGKWNKFQKAHVEKVAEVLKPFDNVIVEVGNELHRNSTNWFQRAVVRWWRRVSNQPIGVSYATGMKPSRGRSQNWLTRQGADWIAPAGSEPIRGFNGPQVFDTDHTSPLRSNLSALQSAYNDGRPIWLMNGFDGTVLRNTNSLRPDLNFINDIV
jgi:hypothetical protein